MNEAEKVQLMNKMLKLLVLHKVNPIDSIDLAKECLTFILEQRLLEKYWEIAGATSGDYFFEFDLVLKKS